MLVIPGGGQENNNWTKMEGRGKGEAQGVTAPPPQKKIYNKQQIIRGSCCGSAAEKP
jgi:hypothetical protein